MKQAGQIVVTPFPYTDLSGQKLRPVLLLRQASPRFDDWLACMVSSQLQQAEPGLDELVLPTEGDFVASGLKAPSVAPDPTGHPGWLQSDWLHWRN